MTTRLLTKRKHRWVEQRKPDVVRGTALSPNASAEVRYQAKLDRLISRMTDDVERTLRELFAADHATEFFAQDASIASQARIVTNMLRRKYEAAFATEATPLAESVASMAEKSSSAALHTSLKQMSGGLSLSTATLSGALGDVMSATVTENVALIKSIPTQYLSGVQQAVMRSIAGGNGLEDLVPYLKKHKGITQRRARMIAHDQTRKAFNNLSKARMVKLGVQKFEWLHTAGSREPRKLHQDYSGRIFSFDDLPVIDENTGEHGIPGQAINCRCRMIPVIDLSGDE